MPYATVADFTARFGADELLQLTDRDHDGVADTGVLDQAISDADAEIDAYLSGRFTLPLSRIPPVLVRIACDVIRYRLWDQAASEEVTTRYNAAVKFLQSVASGLVMIGTDPEPAATTRNADVTLAVSTGRVFSRTTLGDY